MRKTKSQKIDEILACSLCNGYLVGYETYLLCKNCDLKFPNYDTPNMLVNDQLKNLSNLYQTSATSIRERLKDIIPIPDLRIWNLEKDLQGEH